MQSNHQRSIKSTLSLSLSLFAISPFLILSIFWIYSVYNTKTTEINNTYNNLLEKEKAKIKQQVYNIEHFIKEYDTSLEHNLYENIKSRNEEAYQIVKNIFEKYRGKKSLSAIKKLIKETLRPLRYHHNQGYYFIVDYDHTEILYPIHPEYEGANLYNLKDSRGTLVIQKEVKLAQSKGEGFVKDYWPKPGEDPKKSFLKISHIKAFKPLRWLIGTGLYFDDYKASVQNKLLDKIIRFDFFNKKQNFFLDTDQGVPLIFNGKRVYNQKSLMNLKDTRGIMIYQMYKDAALNENGNFFHYHWKRDSADTEDAEKISFAYHFKKWNWIFGAGFYVDDLTKVVKQKQTSLRQGLVFRVTQLIIFIIILLTIILLIVRRMLSKLIGHITIFTHAFQNAIETNQLLDLNQFHFSEFKQLASSTNINILKFKQSQKEAEKAKLIQERNARFISLGEMAGGIAHEINNPLSVIKGYITLLKQNISTEKYPELEKIDLSIDRIASIIKSFKELTSMSATSIKKKKINFNLFIENIKPMFEVNLKKYNIKFNIQTTDDELSLDPTLLGQIITNLINNSIYAIKDKHDRWIEVSTKVIDRKNLEIKVKDSGLRTEIKNPQMIFEPLVTSKPPGEGTGLGLSLSKNMANRMGGDLYLDTNEAHTTFIVTVDISETSLKQE